MTHRASTQQRHTDLYAHRVVLPRAVYTIVLVLTLGLFIAGIPIVARELRTPCAGAGCYRWQPTPRLAADAASLGLSLDFLATYRVVLDTLFVLSFCLIATVIVLRRSDEPIAVFGAIMLVTFGGVTYNDTTRALGLTSPLWWWPRTALACVGWSSLFVFFYLFPDGRFLPRWSRVAAFGWCLVMVLHFFTPDGWLTNGDAAAARVGTASRAGGAGGPLFALAVVSFFGSIVAAQIYRFRRISSPTQRQQTKWVLAGFIAAFGGFIVYFLVVTPLVMGAASHVAATQMLGLLGWDLVLLVLPLSIAVAILRHRLYDIDLIVNRALVYGVLTVCVVAFYVLVVGYAGARLSSPGHVVISLATTGLIAVLFQPFRERLQRAVNRCMYGQRDEPYAVLSRLGRRLEGTLAPDAVLPTICRTVTEALNLPYAAIALAENEGLVVAAAAGRPEPQLLSLPLVYQNEPVGVLLLAPRALGEGFNDADRRLLEDLARHAGAAVHAVRLTAALQRSRERLVLAREEERRRLRRDLHDGLGPMLASLTLKLGVAEDVMDRDPARAHALLHGLKAQTQSAIGDIRQLVEALRPPALDDLGLVGALHEEAGQYGQSGPSVTVDAPLRLPPLPAAVEVAAYRIAQEALTNVARHAGARRCLIRLTVDDANGSLILTISDDGRGIGGATEHGVGLASMQERAAELGGSCTIGRTPSGGTSVCASLPFRALVSAPTSQGNTALATHEAEEPWIRSAS